MNLGFEVAPIRKQAKSSALVDDVMSWEDGTMSQEDEVKFFQGLIDSGQAWQLQGAYGRNAQGLIDAGLCHSASRTASAGLCDTCDGLGRVNGKTCSACHGSTFSSPDPVNASR